MTQQFYIGVDGGATKCVLRVEDAEGNLLGIGKTGPANIRLSVEKTWDAIHDALQQVIQPLGVSLNDRAYQFHAGMGLAGCEFRKAYDAFVRFQHPFTTLQVVSDAHVACLGAHQGEDGEIIIIGSGVVGYQRYQGKTKKVSGWGFPHDDEGSGAWIGLQAVKAAFKSLDGRQAASGTAKAIHAHFNNSWDDLISWANQANSTAYAALAPIVIEHGMQGDAEAIAILKQAARAIDDVSVALQQGIKEKKALPCALVGGIAPFLQPYVSGELQGRLCAARLTPDAGAILLIRQLVKKGELSHE